MTEQNDPQPATPTGPTEPVAPAASAAPTPPAPAGPTAAVADTPPPRRHWYRHVWVPVAGALVLAMLAFGSGFVAGQGASVLGALTASVDDGSGEGRGPGHGDGIPGPRDGGPGSHERGPGPRDDAMPGQRDDTDTE